MLPDLLDHVRWQVPGDLEVPLPGETTGPLAGQTFVAKDVIDVQDRPCSFGNPDFRALAAPAAATAPVLRRLLDSGACLLGMATCCEFMFSLTGVNVHYGTPLNSRARDRIPGGSSSGSAAAVAAGICDFAIGTDTGGSVRVPASLCGIWGMRPTWGRVDVSHVRPMAPDLDTVGWFASAPALLAGVGTVLLDGAASPVPVSRVLLATDLLAQADPAVAPALRRRLPDLAGVAGPVDEIEVAGPRLPDWRDAFTALQGRQVQATILPWVEAHRPRVAEGVRLRLDRAARVSADQAADAAAVREAASARLDALLAPGTVICFPTAPCVAPRLDASDDVFASFRARTLALTSPAGLAGLPQVSLPLLQVEGLPVGLSFLGWRGADEALLDLAVRLGDG